MTNFVFVGAVASAALAGLLLGFDTGWRTACAGDEAMR